MTLKFMVLKLKDGNSKYMLDALKVIDDEYVKIELNTSITPALVKPIEGNLYEYLILPVRISSN